MDSPPADQDVQTVIDLELRLLKHEIRAEPGEVDRLLHPDFSEFGASACTPELARIIDGDLERPVPACPGWTLKQLATHVGRGHRWAAQIVATRASAPVSTRDVPNGRMPDDPAQHEAWLTESADLVAEDVAKADVAVRAPAARPLLLLTRRLPASEPGVEIFGEQALLTHWLERTPF